MMTSVRAWLCGGLGVLLTACGNPQNHTNVPDQPSDPDQTPVIVLGRSTHPPKQAHEPLSVAGDEPELAVATTPEPTNASAADLSALARDPRKITWFPRSKPQIVTEAQGLEALFANTAPNAPDRPKIIRRLADTYVELKNAAMRDKQQLPWSAGANPDAFTKLDKLATAARTKALQNYHLLQTKYPTFCLLPNPTDPAQSQGCSDEVHYFMGLELLQADAQVEARKQFYFLVSNFPQSKWIPRTYLAFGEAFMAEAAGDPSKLELAKQTYEKVTQYPPPQNEVHGFAQYRLAQVQAQKQDHAKALSHMLKAAEFVLNFAHLPIAPPLGIAVRRDVVPIYAVVGAPRKAEPFFKQLAHDPPGSTYRLAAMLDALVTTYLQENKRTEALEVCVSFSGGANALPACQQTFSPSP